MAIDFNKFTRKEEPAKPAGRIDFSKFTKVVSQPTPEPRVFQFPQALGGGSFNQGQPGELVRTERGYAGVEAPGEWREHIFPVALGGTSNIDNIKVYGKEKGKEKTDFEIDQINKYKRGEITLNQARANVLQKYREITGEDPSMDYKDYIKEGVKDTIKNIFSPSRFKSFAFLSPKETKEDIKQTVGAIKNTAQKTKSKIEEAAEAELAGEQGAIRTFLQSIGITFGGVSGAIGDVFTGAVKSVLTEEGEKSLKKGISTSIESVAPAAKKIDETMGKPVGTFINNYKNLDEKSKRDVAALLGVSVLALDLAGSSTLKKTGKTTLKNINKIDETKKVITETAQKAEKVPERTIDFNKFVKKTEIKTPSKADEFVAKAEETRKLKQMENKVIHLTDTDEYIQLPDDITKSQKAKLFDEVQNISARDRVVHISDPKVSRVARKIDLDEALKKSPELRETMDNIGYKKSVVDEAVSGIESGIAKAKAEGKGFDEWVKARRSNKLYHVSDNPNLKISKDYQPKQGQLGKGLYVTKDPEIWQGGQIGKRPYVYEIDASNLKIANDYPTRNELIDWGSKNGYYKKDFLKKPNGEYVLGQDGKPMKVWQETLKAEKLMDYKDPMTGSKMSGLEQEYLKSKGYDGVSASYSPDGEQSLIFNYDKVKISPTKTKSQLKQLWEKQPQKTTSKTTKPKTTDKKTPTKKKEAKSITAQKLNETLPDDYKLNESYDIIKLKDELNKAGKKISKNKEEALAVAFDPKTPTAKRMALLEEMAQIAKKDGDYQAVNMLFTEANKIGTETAQGLNMMKALYAANPEYTYIQKILNTRLQKVSIGAKDIKKAREMIKNKAKEIVKKTKRAVKIEDAQKLLDKIMCK